MADRRCVYTVLVGGYETLLEQHIARQHDTDLIVFTDTAIPADSGWQARPLELVLPADPNRSSRRPKILVHEYLDDYDASFYIDNNILLTVDPAIMFDTFLPAGVGMAAFAHSFRATVRAEFDEVVLVGKEAAWVRDEQLAHYEATDPGALDLHPIAGGFLFRRHADPVVRRAMELWWAHLLRYSRRDQLSLWVAARAAGLDIAVHDVDNHLSPYHEWPRMAYRDEAGGAPLPTGPQEIIDALEAEVASLLHEREVEREELHRHGVELLEELHRSTSWKVTRPLRFASRLAQRARERRAGRRTE